ncbi:MAG: MATE family efflux transporter, partial [Lentisphaerae bacterium]|nr:MATE family efflux transporter [Lentisphaerota bacterium]
PIFMFFMASSSLQATGDTITPMFSMLVANILNMILDPIMIFGLFGFSRLEAKGAALATIISQLVATGYICWMLFFRKNANYSIRWVHFKPTVQMMKNLIGIGLPSSGQLLTRSIMSLVLMRIVAGFGTAAVAAYGIGMRFHHTSLMPAFALGGAAATMVGQNLGAGLKNRAVKAAWLASWICVAIMASIAVLMIPFAAQITSIFSNSEEVIGLGANYLKIVTPCYIFVAFSIVLGRAVNGAGDTLAPMITTIIALWAFQVPLAAILPRYMAQPTNGVWWAMGAAVVVHGLLNTAWFMYGKWLDRKI